MSELDEPEDREGACDAPTTEAETPEARRERLLRHLDEHSPLD